jgi:hypothetical protein
MPRRRDDEMTEIESGSYCELHKDFLTDFLVNFKCPRAVMFGCLADPKCQNVGYAIFVDGERVIRE